MHVQVGKRVSLIILSVLVMAAGGLASLKSVHAAAANSIYLTPASSSVQKGNYVTVGIRVNPSTNIDAVQGSLTFDTASLKFISVDTSSSAFVTELGNSQSGGTINFARSTSTSGADVTTDSLIENVTFQALTDSGSVVLHLVSVDDDSAGATTHPTAGTASVSFTPAPVATPTCAAGQVGTYPNCTTPTSTSTTTTKSSGSSTSTSPGSSTKPPTTTTPTTPVQTSGSLTPPVVSDKQAQYSQCAISVTTPTATQVYIRYGIDANTLDINTPLSDSSTTHDITLDPGTLTPGVKYFYVVVSKDAAGNTSQSAVDSFQLKGLKVSVRVTDKNGKPVANKTVALHSTVQTAKTDSKGNVTFDNVSPGTHHVVYTAGKSSYEQQVAVVNNIQTSGTTQTSAVQNFSVSYNLVQTSLTVPLWIWLCVVILIVAAVVALGQAGRLGVALQFRSPRNAGVGGAPLTSQLIVVGGASVSESVAKTEAIASEPKIDEKLNAIASPSVPEPGSVVAPKQSDRESTKESDL